MEKRWHGSVGWKLSDRYGGDCGYIGSAYPCTSYEDGITQALAWLRKHPRSICGPFLVHTFNISVRYF